MNPSGLSYIAKIDGVIAGVCSLMFNKTFDAFKTGGANIVSIPKAILKTLGLHVGSRLDLSIVDYKIVLTPVVEKQTLEDLLAGTPQEKLQFTEEDREWLEARNIGKEI